MNQFNSKFALNDVQVTPGARNKIKTLLPNLDAKPEYARTLAYLAFSANRENGDGPLILDRTVAAALQGKPCNHHYRMRAFLEEYAKAVAPIEYSHWSWQNEQATTIVSAPHADDVRAIITAEEASLRNEDKVWLTTGSKVRPGDATVMRHELRTQAEKSIGYAKCPDAGKLLQLLNSASPHRYSAMVESHYNAAWSAAQAMPLGNSRNIQLALLKQIQVQPQPFYKAVPRSTRIFGANPSILWLQKNLRKEFCKDWYEADLESAQFAIIATIWNVAELKTYLSQVRAGNGTISIWKTLAQWFQVELTPEVKSALKIALYATVFGAADHTLAVKFKENFFPGNKNSLPGDPSEGEAMVQKWKEQPLMAAIFAARQEQINRIKKQRGGFDAYRTWHPIEGRQVRLPNDKTYWDDGTKSILAVIAQSHEMKLLSGVINLAGEHAENPRGFTITSSLHDGFTYTARKVEDQSSWKKRLIASVAKAAEELEIDTRLIINNGEE